MIRHRLRRPRRTRQPLVTLAVSAGVLGSVLTCAPSAVAESTFGYRVSIEDRIGLAGDARPDAVVAGGYATTSYPSDVSDGGFRPFIAQIERSGVVIEANLAGKPVVTTPELRDGDVIVLRSALPPQEVLARHTYRKLPLLDGPVCAGANSYDGSVLVPGMGRPYGTAVLWETFPAGQAPPAPGYPTWGMVPVDAAYPGWYPGSGAKASAALWTESLGGGRFRAVPTAPLVPGMHVYLSATINVPNLFVTVQTDQLVVSCGATPTPTPTPTPTATPAAGATPTPTSAPQSQPATKPVGDVTPPKATLKGDSSKDLRKLGRKKLLLGGYPVKITSDEPARLVGKLTLLGGKRPFVSTVSQPVIKGITLTEIQLSPTVKKLIARTKKPRLRLELALVDPAGNRTTFPPIAVTLPRR